MPREGQPIKLDTPVLGVHRGCGFEDQPPGSCPDALNVLPFDWSGRRRIAKRFGTARHFTTQVTASSGANQINALASFSVPASSLSDGSGLFKTDRFIYADGGDIGGSSDANWDQRWQACATENTDGYASTDFYTFGSEQGAVVCQSAYVNDWRNGVFSSVDTTPNNRYTLDAGAIRVAALVSSVGAQQDITVTIVSGDKVDSTAFKNTSYMTPDYIGPFVRSDATVTQMVMALLVNTGGGGTDAKFRFRIEQITASGGDVSRTTLAQSAEFTMGGVTGQAVSGMTAYANGLYTFTIRLQHTGLKFIATLTGYTTSGGTPMIPTSASSTNSLRVEYTDSGSIYSSNQRVGVACITGYSLGAPWTSANEPLYKYFRNVYYAPTGTSVQSSVSDGSRMIGFVGAWLTNKAWHGRTDTRTGTYISSGDMRLVTGSGTSGHAGSEISAVAAYRKFFSTDGTTYKMLDPITDTETDWRAATTAGSFPTGAHLVSLFRGRLVLASSRQWWMSRVADYNDWDSTSTTTGAAIDGTLGQLGQVPDAIVALIPSQSNATQFIFGCASSMWLMSAETTTNPQFAPMSTKVGILGQKAWTFDKEGRLYWLGQGGLYRAPRLGTTVIAQPECVSKDDRGRDIIPELVGVDTQTYRPSLAYDATSDTVHIFLTTKASPASDTHYCYDVSGGGFWPEKMTCNGTATHFGPFAACELNGDKGKERRLLMGGYDGYIRRFEPLANDDDMTDSGVTAAAVPTAGTGVAITSSINFTPLRASTEGDMRVRISEVDATLDSVGSPSVLLVFYADESPMAAAESVSAASPPGVITLGDGLTISRVSVGHQSVQPRISHTAAGSRWAIESVEMWVVGVGRRRTTP